MLSHERPTLARRFFLQGLASLPMVGGSLAIIGQPTAAAVPVTTDLLWSYKDWLRFEHRMASYELAKYDIEQGRLIERNHWSDNNPGSNWHFQWKGRGPAGWIDAPQPSTRAAVVLSAVGVPLA